MMPVFEQVEPSSRRGVSFSRALAAAPASCLAGRISAALFVVALLLGVPATLYADCTPAQGGPVYPVGSTPLVRLHWQSFVNNGFQPSFDYDKFVQIIQDVISRWEQVGSFKVHPRYDGVTSDYNWAGGLLIRASEEAGGALAKTGWACGGGHSDIRFARKDSVGGTNFDWTTAYSTSAVEAFAVLMHEYGHALGIDHIVGHTRETMDPFYHWDPMRYGPTMQSATNMVAQYGVEDRFRLGAYISSNNGATWSVVASNIGAIPISTLMDPSAIVDGPTKHILAYPDSSKSVCWDFGIYVIGRFNFVSWDTNFRCITTFKTHYGVGLNGQDAEYMAAYVDRTDDNNNVRILYWDDGGINWSRRDPPPGSHAVGTPGIWRAAWNTFVLVYPSLDLSSTNSPATGRVVARVTTNAGLTWGPEQLLTYAHALSGVSVTGFGSDVITTFTDADPTTTGANHVHTLWHTLSGATLTFVDESVIGGSHSSARPSSTSNAVEYVLGERLPTTPGVLLYSRMSHTGWWNGWLASSGPTVQIVTSPAMAGGRSTSLLFSYTSHP